MARLMKTCTSARELGSALTANPLMATSTPVPGTSGAVRVVSAAAALCGSGLSKRRSPVSDSVAILGQERQLGNPRQCRWEVRQALEAVNEPVWDMGRWARRTDVLRTGDVDLVKQPSGRASLDDVDGPRAVLGAVVADRRRADRHDAAFFDSLTTPASSNVIERSAAALPP